MTAGIQSALLLMVPILPLATAGGLALAGLFARSGDGRLRRWPGWVALASSAFSLGILLLLWGREIEVSGEWLGVSGLAVTVALESTELTYFLAVLVASISTLVILYSIKYMETEAGVIRFFAELALFVGAMLALVLAGSWIVLFSAWEFVGLASFLLIGFWYREAASRRAAQRAFLMTRVADMGLLLAWLHVTMRLHTSRIDAFLGSLGTPAFTEAELLILALLFLLAVVGKSAQLPLTAWLPAAMAGPTPVSALIHSATMVAAGVFLLLRLFPLYEASPWALTLVLWLGLAGAVVAAIVATGQNDLKRLLAWSTISQLGEMVFAIGLGAPLAGAYHLATHSVFKSTLFLTAGAVDHGAGTRDLSQLGGLRRSMPLTAAVFGLAALALAGVPPLSGFWSEDLIVAAAAAKHPALGLVSVGLVLLAGLYIGRAGVATFLGTRRSPPPQEGAGPKDPGGSMMLAMLLGGAAAALTGLLLHPAVEGLLPFAKESGAGAAWRIAAGIAGLVGLLAAWLLVRSKGTASLFEPLPRLLERALEAVPELGMRTAEASSFPLPRFEAALDGGAQAARGLVLALTGGAQRSEAFLDGVALAGVRAVEGVTELTERTESRVFGRGGDRAAELLSLAGARLRPAQTGRVYLYTLGLFLWTFGTAVVSLLFWR